MNRLLISMFLLTVLVVMSCKPKYDNVEEAFGRCSAHCAVKYGTKCKSVGIKANKHLKFRCFK